MMTPPPMSEYAKVWLKSLASAAPHLDWHLDVIQNQFLDSEGRLARRDFIQKHSGVTHPAVTGPGSHGHQVVEDRELIVMKACKILREHGRKPKINLLWFPLAWAENEQSTPP